MEYLHRLVEDRIQKVQDEGVFDNRRELRPELNLLILDFNLRRTGAATHNLPQIWIVV